MAPGLHARLQEFWVAERDEPVAMRVRRLCYGTTGGSLASTDDGVKIDFSSFAGYRCHRTGFAQPSRRNNKQCRQILFRRERTTVAP